MNATKRFAVKLSIVLMLVSSALITYTLSKDFSNYKSVWDSENVCIAEFVSLGIERSSIVRTNGTCVFVR